MSRRQQLCVVLGAGVLALLAALALAPGYFTSRGLPLDDAWIHLVYGRSLAAEGILAYNPGVPATGATSLLWPVLLALPHLAFSGLSPILVTVKLLGVALHLGAAALAWAVARRFSSPRLATGGAVLVALNPDLLAASLSGMEVSLATVTVLALTLAALARRRVLFLGAATLCPLVRPELASVAFLLPALLWIRRDRPALLRHWALAALGSAAGFGLIAWRNLAVSGLPLPATFYAKVGQVQIPLSEALLEGFRRFARVFVLLDATLLLLPLLGLGLLWLLRPPPGEPDPGAVGTDPGLDPRQVSSALLWTGALYWAQHFVLVRWFDATSFYAQRYLLPVHPLILLALPPLVHALWVRLPGARLRRGVLVALGLVTVTSLVYATVRRTDRLENDARNIDEVQVAMGRSLSRFPAGTVVWAVDAGALRYFAAPGATVVDLMALNSHQLLGEGAQAYLDRHRPHLIELVQGWTDLDPTTRRQLRGRRFVTEGDFTISALLTQREHHLARCPPAVQGRPLELRGREVRYTLSCAQSPPGSPAKAR